MAIAVYLVSFALTATTPFEWRATVADNYTGPLNETVNFIVLNLIFNLNLYYMIILYLIFTDLHVYFREY